MIKEIHGDIFETDTNCIVHGVNCAGKFNAGLAKQIAIRFPEAKICYKSKFLHPGWELCEYQVVPIESKFYPNIKYIVNLATQQSYGNDDKEYACKRSIRRGLAALLSHLECFDQIKSIAIPRIGCGLGGLNWERDISPIFKELSSAFPFVDIKVYFHERFNR